MITLPKSMTIAFLVLSIFISGLCADLVRAQSSAPAPMIRLTPEEQAWLTENPLIKLATLTNQPPFSMMDADGNHTGILADILEMLSKAIGQKIAPELVNHATSATHDVAKKDGIYGSASILKTSRHVNEYLLTDPFMTTPFYIYATIKNQNEIRRPADLSGKRVAVPRNHRAVAAYLAGIGGVQTIPVDTPLAQMQKVVSGEADVLIGYFTYPYLVNKYLMVDLVLSFVAKSDQGIRIGVNPEYPILHGILNKAIATLDDMETNAILRERLGTGAAGKAALHAKWSEEEKAWLRENPTVTVGIWDLPPANFMENGVAKGYRVELLEMMLGRAGLRPTYRFLPLRDVVKGLKEGDVDIGLSFIKSKERAEYLNYALHETPINIAIFAQKSRMDISDTASLKGKVIGSYKGYAMDRVLRKVFPKSTVIQADDTQGMFQLVSIGKADFCVQEVMSGNYHLWKGNFTNLKHMGFFRPPGGKKKHSSDYVVRKSLPLLTSILHKAEQTLHDGEKQRMWNRWYAPQKQKWQPAVALTPEERAWLAQGYTVRIRVVDYPPYQILEGNKEPQGIVIDYLSLIKERSGVNFQFEVSGRPFSEFLESIKQGKGPDMTAIIQRTPERERYLSFTVPYLSSPYVIFTREEDNLIFDIQDLKEKSLAVPRGFFVQEQLTREYPDIRQVLCDSDEAALQAVATGQADAYIGNLTVASHIIHGRGFSHLRVAAGSPFGDQAISMGNRSDWPELTSIINKALASITEEEKTAIRNKYLAIKFEQGVDKAEALRWVSMVGGSSLAIVLIFLFWNRQMSREIGKRKQTEKDLKKARDDAEAAQGDAEAANQAKSIFLANMSHELRTPLNAILGFSGMLAREKNTTPGQQEKLSIINRSGRHLLGMINEVLDLSKIEAGSVELQEHPFDLVDLIKEISLMVQSRATEKGLSVVVQAEKARISYVKFDVGKLRQILINLLNNAVKFTDKGGVTIRSATEPNPKEPNRCHIVIEVEDTGPGIDPARQAQIFDPFVQGIDVAARRGTGLGLSICKGFAELMDGTIEVESEVGKGSLFRVRLPAEIAKAAEVRTSVDDKPRVIGLAPTEKTWRILVADDNRENLLLLKSLLEVVGFFVLEAKNGQEAVAAFKKESPDFIWMDMRMPVMDGYEAVRQIRQCAGGDTIPIIAITASAFREQRHEILAAGCDDMLTKPFRPHQIFEAMGRLLDIEYIYESVSEAAPARGREVELTTAMLADLPADLLQELWQMSLLLDVEAISAVIQRIEPLALDTAKGLQTLLDNFEINLIRDLLGEIHKQ